MESCWLRRTPLEVALMLILIVSIPFLIGLITTYIIFLVNNNKPVNCKTYCEDNGLIHTGRGRNVAFEDRPTCNASDNLNRYPFLASIVQEKYDAGIRDVVYAGTGVIMSSNIVMVSSSIMESWNKSDRSLVTEPHVRAGSEYWAKGGWVLPIISKTYVNSAPSLCLLSLKENLPRVKSISAVLFSENSSVSMRNLILYGWQNIKNLPLRQREKFKTAITRKIVVVNNKECNKKILERNMFCGKEAYSSGNRIGYGGYPLLNADKYLIGIQIDEMWNSEKGNAYHIFQNVSVVMKQVFAPTFKH